jgi:hypothetical protein
MTDSARLSSALLLSILLHAVLVGLLSGLSTLRRAAVTTPPLLDIDLVSLPQPPKAAPPPLPAPAPAPVPVPPQPMPESLPPEAAPAQPAKEPPPRALPLPEQQIVSPSEGGEEKAPEKTRLLSDRDTTVKEQSIRRGEPAPGAASRPEQAREGRRSGSSGKEDQPPPRERHESPPTEIASLRKLPGLDELLPRASRLASEGYGRSGKEGESADGESVEKRDLLKSGEGWQAATTRPGALDFLPDVREGDITLLNTKAELFSPFVRRVAVRVFGHLVILLRRQLEGLTASTREFVTVEAIMNKHGDLVSLEVKDRSVSSSLSVDRSLQRACHDGFFDRNPPAGAESADGKIHFLLHTRVATLTGPDGRNIGYEAMFSAGLL